MDGLKEILDDSAETFGALNKEDDANLTISLSNGDTITTEVVGVDPKENVCRYFHWQALTEDIVRDVLPEDVAFEHAKTEIDIGSTILVIDGICPWDSVVNIENTSELKL